VLFNSIFIIIKVVVIIIRAKISIITEQSVFTIIIRYSVFIIVVGVHINWCFDLNLIMINVTVFIIMFN
jgi:hypothetical protein